jgi:hypothetical protein
MMEDKHFDQLVSKMDSDGDGDISYQEFLKYFGKVCRTQCPTRSPVQLLPPHRPHGASRERRGGRTR